MRTGRNEKSVSTDLDALLEGVELDLEKAFSEAAPEAEKRPLAGDALRVTNRRLVIAHKRQFRNLAGTTRAVRQIRELPAPGFSLHCLMGGDFNGWDLVPAIHRMAGRIEALHIATLGFNHANNLELCEMLDKGHIGTVALICSHYFKGADPDVYQQAERELLARGQRITATRTHAKILLLDTAAGRFTVESSANLRSCKNIEQFALTHCPALYEFHREWIERALASPHD